MQDGLIATKIYTQVTLIYIIEYIKSNQSCEDVCTKGSLSRMSFIRIYITFFIGNLVTSIVSEFDDSEDNIASIPLRSHRNLSDVSLIFLLQNFREGEVTLVSSSELFISRMANLNVILMVYQIYKNFMVHFFRNCRIIFLTEWFEKKTFNLLIPS